MSTRVWIRVSKHGKYPSQNVLKFVLYYFIREIRNGLSDVRILLFKHVLRNLALK